MVGRMDAYAFMKMNEKLFWTLSPYGEDRQEEVHQPEWPLWEYYADADNAIAHYCHRVKTKDMIEYHKPPSPELQAVYRSLNRPPAKIYPEGASCPVFQCKRCKRFFHRKDGRLIRCPSCDEYVKTRAEWRRRRRMIRLVKSERLDRERAAKDKYLRERHIEQIQQNQENNLMGLYFQLKEKQRLIEKRLVAEKARALRETLKRPTGIRKIEELIHTNPTEEKNHDS